jgi:alpha-tubulin suppressor-like RCC1 family protein
VFLCGEVSDGLITMCDSSLFSKLIHEVAGCGDTLIGLSKDGCYDLNSNLPVNKCDFKASHFCSGKETTYALSSSNSVVYSWGKGTYGELGLGFCRTKVEDPMPIKHKASFSSISCGESHCAALDLIGNAYSWGQNFDRQLGLYRKCAKDFNALNCVVEELMFVPSLLPFSIQCPILKISCGSKFTVAVGKNGDLWSWGSGECGQLGTGRCTKKEIPTKITIYPNQNTTENDYLKFVDIACGASHVIAVAEDNSVYGWGLNKRGQLGLSDTATRHIPSLLPDILLSKVYADGNSSAGINISGDLYTWGSGTKYRLMQMREVDGERIGDNSHRSSPSYVDILYGNIVHSFTFSRIASAALVITRLYEVCTLYSFLLSFLLLSVVKKMERQKMI